MKASKIRRISNIILAAAAIACIGITTIITPQTVKCNTIDFDSITYRDGSSELVDSIYGYDDATGHYIVDPKYSGVYAAQNADKLAGAVEQAYLWRGETNAYGDPYEHSFAWVSSDEMSIFSTIYEMYGEYAVDLYIACVKAGCFTDFYDYVGTTEYLSRCRNGWVCSSCTRMENALYSSVGPWGTYQQYEDQRQINCATDTYDYTTTKHSTTKGTSGMVATGKASTTIDKDFDATFYAALYPDVAAAFGTDSKALYNHYKKYGKAEGRYKNATEYNAALAKTTK